MHLQCGAGLLDVTAIEVLIYQGIHLQNTQGLSRRRSHSSQSLMMRSRLANG